LQVTIVVQDRSIEIHPIVQNDLVAVLEVYKQCEDFLALGPVPTASMEMVLKDIEISRAEHGIFCGIYTAAGKMIGVIDYVSKDYGGSADTAFLELLMIDVHYRKQGIGKAVVEAVETEIRKNPKVKMILSGVQVNNPQAVKFWQRNGYRIVSEPKLLPDQTTAVDLRKDLSEGMQNNQQGFLKVQNESANLR
jgi:ribosomal protein S18 acetylase RimI-like enzyme